MTTTEAVAYRVALAAAALARGLTKEEFQAWFEEHEADPAPLDIYQAYNTLSTMEPRRTPPDPEITATNTEETLNG